MLPSAVPFIPCTNIQDRGENLSGALLGLMVTGNSTDARGRSFPGGHRQSAVWTLGCLLKQSMADSRQLAVSPGLLVTSLSPAHVKVSDPLRPQQRLLNAPFKLKQLSKQCCQGA